MNYGELQTQDYGTYCRNTWFWRRASRAKFSRVHAACLQVIAEDRNPSRCLAKNANISDPNFKADWIDFAIDAVLTLLKVPEEQRIVWRTIIRFVLQILISSLLVAQKEGEFGFSEGGLNFQVKTWAAEVEAELR